MPSPRFASPPQRQLFSIPYNFVLYLIEKPTSPDALKNLYQTCKFFFIRNQIHISPRIVCREGKFQYWWYMEKPIETTAKFWATSDLVISCKIDFIKFYQIHLSKFYRISPTNLQLLGIQISMTEFDFLIAEGKVKEFELSGPVVSGATIDVILAKLPTVVKFVHYNSEEIYSLETFQRLNLIQRHLKFTHCKIGMFEMAETFSIPLLIKFVQQNSDPNSYFEFFFSTNDNFIEEFQNWCTENDNILKYGISWGRIGIKVLKFI